MKLSKAVDAFIESDNRSPATDSSYRAILNRFMAAIGGIRPVSSIRPIDITLYFNDMRSQDVLFKNHKTRPPIKKGYSEATIQKHLKCIRVFFNWCIKQELCVKNPAYAVKRKNLEGKIDREKAMTEEELGLITSFVRWKPRDYAIVQLLADTGARAGGIASMTITATDLKLFHASVTEKGNKIRRIWFSPQTGAAISRWLSDRPDCDHDFLFCGIRKPYPPLSADAVSQIIYRAARKVGIDRPLGSHSLRHRLGHQLSRMKVGNKVGAIIMGHESPSTFDGAYSEDSTEYAEKTIRLLHEQKYKRNVSN